MSLCNLSLPHSSIQVGGNTIGKKNKKKKTRRKEQKLITERYHEWLLIKQLCLPHFLKSNSSNHLVYFKCIRGKQKLELLLHPYIMYLSALLHSLNVITFVDTRFMFNPGGPTRDIISWDV